MPFQINPSLIIYELGGTIQGKDLEWSAIPVLKDPAKQGKA